MKNKQPPFENQAEYEKYANALVDQYRPQIQQGCEIDSWPDEVTDRNLVISDRDTGKTVGRISFGVCEDGHAEIIIPADYKQPKAREPIVSIDSPEQLPPAGELIYKIIEHVDWIIVSPHAEVTLIRKIGALLGRLHLNHDYSLETIRSGLVEEAQNRGDLPERNESE